MHAILRSPLSFSLAEWHPTSFEHPVIRNALSPEIAHSLLGVKQPWIWIQALSLTSWASFFPRCLLKGSCWIKCEVNGSFCYNCHCHHHHQYHHHCTIILFCNQNPAIGRSEARLIWYWTSFWLRASTDAGVWDGMGCRISSQVETNKLSYWRKGTWKL